MAPYNYPQVFSGVIAIAHGAMLLVVIAQGLLIFVSWGDDVAAPNALRRLDGDPMGGRSRDSTKKEDSRAVEEGKTRGGGSGCVCGNANYRGNPGVGIPGKALGKVSASAKDVGSSRGGGDASKGKASSRKKYAGSSSSSSNSDGTRNEKKMPKKAPSETKRHFAPSPARSCRYATAGTKRIHAKSSTPRFATTPEHSGGGGEAYMGDFAGDVRQGENPLAPRSTGRARSIFVRPAVGVSAERLHDLPPASRNTAVAGTAAAGVAAAMAARVSHEREAPRAREGGHPTAVGSVQEDVRSRLDESPTPSEMSGWTVTGHDTGKDRRGGLRAVTMATARDSFPSRPVSAAEKAAGRRPGREGAAPKPQRSPSRTRGFGPATASFSRNPQENPSPIETATPRGSWSVLCALPPAVSARASAEHEPTWPDNDSVTNDRLDAREGGAAPYPDSRPSPVKMTVFGTGGASSAGRWLGTPSSGRTERYWPSSQVVLSPVESVTSGTSSKHSAPLLAPLTPSLPGHTSSPLTVVSSSRETASSRGARAGRKTGTGMPATRPPTPGTNVSAKRLSRKGKNKLENLRPRPAEAAEAGTTLSRSKTENVTGDGSIAMKPRPGPTSNILDEHSSSEKVSVWARWVPGTVVTGQEAGMEAEGGGGRGPNAGGNRVRSERVKCKVSPTEIDAMFPVEDEVSTSTRKKVLLFIEHVHLDFCVSPPPIDGMRTAVCDVKTLLAGNDAAVKTSTNAMKGDPHYLTCVIYTVRLRFRAQPTPKQAETCARHERQAPRAAAGGIWVRHASSASGQATTVVESFEGDVTSAGHSLVDISWASPSTRGRSSVSGSSLSGESGWSIGGLGAGGGGFAGNAKRSFFPEALAPLCSSPAGVAAASAWRVDAAANNAGGGVASPRKHGPGP